MTTNEESGSKFQRNNVANLKWIPVLMYHHVVPRKRGQVPGHLDVTIDEFEEQIKFLKERGYESVHMEEAAKRLMSGEDNLNRMVVITFDDGYQDVFLHAFPILKKYDYIADLFLVSSHFDDSIRCAPASISQVPFLEIAEIEEMAGYGIGFGSHTVSHRRLTGLGQPEAKRELEESKVTLESRLGLPINCFSFPHGCSTPQLERMTQEAGYIAACGIEQREHTLFNFSRIDAAQCRGADLRWQMHTSGIYFNLRQRQSLRKLKDLLFRLKPGFNGEADGNSCYFMESAQKER